MLEVINSTRINTDANEDDLRPGEYRDALNISLLANEVGAFSKGTTFGNIDTNIVFKGLNPDAICLGTAIDTAGVRAIVTFYQKIAVPYTIEYQGILDYAISRGYQVPSKNVQAAQNYLIALLKQDGIWNGLDVFYCFYGDGDENFAKINWKLPNDSTTAVNHGMEYQANWGFKGNGVDAYLDTTWIPSLAVKFQQDNSCFIVGYEEISLAVTIDGVLDGANNRAIIYPWPDTNNAYAAVNSANEDAFIDPAFNSTSGIFFSSRSDNATSHVRKNTSTVINVNRVSSLRPTISFSIGALHQGAVHTSFSTNRYSVFAAGEYLNTFDRETKFYTNWQLYKNSFITPLLESAYVQEVLMYILPPQMVGTVTPILQSSLLLVNDTSYLDGYAFVNELFFFNFRESAPKMINIERALNSPGFYDNLSETSLTIIKPHPPFSPIPTRVVGVPPNLVNAPIQKKPFQFMMVYNFVDNEQSTKSPASEYLNSLDDYSALTTSYDTIDVQMEFPQKDYSIVANVELFVRNSNNIEDWRSVNIFKRQLFVQAGENYRYTYPFKDNVVGNFYPAELATKINDTIPQRSNYLTFIENRIFLIDSLIDYDFTSTFQIKIDNTTELNLPTIDDRGNNADSLYFTAEFEYDSEYTVGLAFYDKYGRKYPSSVNDRKLVTAAFVPAVLPGVDSIPLTTTLPQLSKKKITATYDLRAAGNINNYGKPPSYAYWWGMIRGKNTKWEFMQSVVCLLRFPYSITKWTDTDPANFPLTGGELFLEDGYLYWNPEVILAGAGLDLTKRMVNDYIDVVVPPNFPYPIDATVLIDFMYEVCSDVAATKLQLLNREVIETFANKIRIRGDRSARWFSNDAAKPGQYFGFPRFTSGVNLLNANGRLFRDETLFPLVIKRRRQNNLANIILYDTPQISRVYNAGTRFCSFQPGQSATINRVEFPPLFIAPSSTRTLEQGDILIQPIFLTPTTVAFNHRIKILWGPNVGDALRLKIKVSLWQLNDLNQPILELYSATGDAGGDYYVKDGELAEYLINSDAELINGWYGYGIQILTASSTNIQFDNPDFDDQLQGWSESQEGLPNIAWLPQSSGQNNYVYVNVSSLLGGFSRTIYQYLPETTKNDITVEVQIEGIGLAGPPGGGAINQYPGNANVPLVINANEPLLIYGNNVVPFFIDCTTIVRTVTLTGVTVNITTPASLGSFIGIDIWMIDQTTKAPISRIAGATSPWVAFPLVPGNISIPLTAPVVIDTTAWYGIGVTYYGPAYSNFQNNNYQNGSTGWVTKGGSVPWVFQPDTQGAPIYQYVSFSPSLGADLGYQSLGFEFHHLQPIYLGLGVNPAGWDNHTINIDWGDNFSNGWHGKTIQVGIWQLNQSTLKPLTEVPLMWINVTIGSNGPQDYYVSNANVLPPDDWYGFGLGNPSGHTSSIGTQFGNPSFQTSLSPWTTAPGINSTAWGVNVGQHIAVASSVTPSILFNTGRLGQALPNYVQVSLIYFTAQGFAANGSASTYIGTVAQQTVNFQPSLTLNNEGSINFEPMAALGGVAAVEFSGTANPNANLALHDFRNSFNAYLYSTPKVRKYAPGASEYRSWTQYGKVDGSAGIPFDQYWTNGYQYWGFQGGSGYGTMFVREGVPQGSAIPLQRYAILIQPQFGSPAFTAMVYGLSGMGDQPAKIGTLVVKGWYVTSSTIGNVYWQVWAFNDPANPTGSGVLVYQSSTITNPTGALNTSLSGFSMPGGYEYLGIRASTTNGVELDITDFYFIHTGAFKSWKRINQTLGIVAKERQLIGYETTIIANWNFNNMPAGGWSGRLGQNSILGLSVSAEVELFAGLANNNFDMILYDSNDNELGRTVVVGQPLQAVNVGVVITVNGITPPLTDGLYIAFENKNASGTLSGRVRKITNINVAPKIAANNTSPYKTWQQDSAQNNVQLVTTAAISAQGTDTIPSAGLDVTVVLADAAGIEISGPQTFTPNTGIQSLLFAPTLQADGNFNYGVKVKNNPANQQGNGVIRLHSVSNVATNEGIATIISNTIDPVNPLYEAWNRFSTGIFVRSGYVSNFIAVVNDLIMSAFTPVVINPTSYHVVTNVTQSGIEGHSTSYGTGSNIYFYGLVYPCAASDPDAPGIVFLQKTGQSIGDINIIDTELGEKSHSNIVRWSDPIIVDTKTNNLNAFSGGNNYAVDFQRGVIQVMLAMHDHTIFCVHEQGMSSLYVQRNMVISPEEVASEQLFLTTKVIGSDNKLASNLGTINPESCRVVESGTIAYGFDLLRKSFWQKTNNGVRNLTYECNAKNLFNQICYNRLKAHREGEDIKIYSGYNEKEKVFFLTFAPFVYRGQPYPAVTVAYSAYIDGFLSQYSFKPISYVAIEDIVHTIKARELNDPDFLGEFSSWKISLFTGNAVWFVNKILNPGYAQAITTVPGGTRIFNPDFAQGAVSWSTYGGGSDWAFMNDGAETTIPNAASAKELVNTSGAPGVYFLRINVRTPVAGISYTIRVYNPGGGLVETLAGPTLIDASGDVVVPVSQTLAGRIGVGFDNASGAPYTLKLNLFTTVVKTALLYQSMPVVKEDLRVQLLIPKRTGSIHAFVYAFNDPLNPLQSLLADVNLIHLKDNYTLSVNVPSGMIAKYVGIYAITDYDLTLLRYFNVNSVPSIWAHNQSGRTNNFYGVQYDTMIDLVLNVQAGQVRIFNSIGVMSETVWSVESILTSEQQVSALSEQNFRLRDGIYSANFMRDILTPQESLPDPVKNTPIMHGSKLMGYWLRIVLRNSETARRVELRAVYLGSDILSGNLLGKK